MFTLEKLKKREGYKAEKTTDNEKSGIANVEMCT